MKVIIAEDLDLREYAGRKIWMMGFTMNHTRILNPIEVFAYVGSPTTDIVPLALVRVAANGTVLPVVDLDIGEKQVEDGTYIFLAKTEDDLFNIPEVDKIKNRFTRIIDDALTIRHEMGLSQDMLFFECDNRE